jgi:hypothetical protein
MTHDIFLSPTNFLFPHTFFSASTSVLRKLSLRTFAYQLLRFRNFWIFVLINLVQVFNCHFNSNFMSIFLDSLVGSGVSVFVHSFILSAAATLPHLFVVFLAPVIHKKSLYFLLEFLFLLKLSLAAFAYFGLSERSVKTLRSFDSCSFPTFLPSFQLFYLVSSLSHSLTLVLALHLSSIYLSSFSLCRCAT